MRIYNMLPYTLNPQRKTTKNLRITINREGLIKVTKPRHVTIKQMEDFLLSKSDWINQTLEKIKTAQDKNPNLPPIIRLTKKDFLRLKPIALQIATTRLILFNQYYKLTYKNITIKNQKTRWGSCSHTGNLNFNYKLAIIPTHLADYIIVHELCHLGQFNHSYKFWDLVKETIPNYKMCINELKKINL